MQRLRTWASWLDSHLLLILAAFLFAFIPLFPKIPLFDILPGYIVRVRVEDFLVGFTGIVWLTQILRKKVEWKHSVFFFVLAYSALGITSMLLGSVLTQTIPPQLIHIGKSALHFFRYLEYFSLFFFTYSAVKTKKHIEIFVGVLAITVIAIALYGAGQKYLNWPLYSTMNREYSKGEALYLSEYARVQSTFAGHYDLTAYLVLVLPILFALTLSTSSRRTQILFSFSQLAGIWLLLVGSSKGSLAAYVVTIALVLFFKFKNTKKSVPHILKWILVGMLAMSVFAVGILFFSPELYKTLANTSKPLAPAYSIFLKIDARLPDDSPLKLVKTNRTAEGSVKPDDVYVDVPDYVKVATTSATGETTYYLVEKERTWSENALKYGLSMGIRLDTLWPQALAGLMKNPLTGSGYATLNKGESSVYTEADSTDNNFLRVLGETGVLGFALFFGLIFYLGITAFKKVRATDSYISTLNAGYIAGLVGLLINAITIDVFAASKVAFTFWAISGFVYASTRVTSPQEAAKIHKSHLTKVYSFLQTHGIVLLAIGIYFFATYQNPFTEKSAILNFTHNMHGAEYVAAARCFLRNGSFNLCRGDLILDQTTNVYSILLVPFLKIYNNPGMYFFLNAAYLGALLAGFYFLLLKLTPHKWLRFSMVFLLLSTPTFLTFTAVPASTMLPLLLAVILLLVVFFIQQTLLLLPSLEKPIRVTTQAVIAISCGLFVITFLNAQQFSKTLATFSGTQSHWRNMAVTQMNRFFYDALIGERATLSADNLPYVITATNPYYVDMFSNGMYSLLPLYNQQRHMEHPNSVWGEFDYSNLLTLYASILTTHPVYLSEVDITTPETKDAFNHIKNQFDLTVSRLGCDYNCNIYELHEEAEPVSAQPTTLTGSFDLDTLTNNYSFAVVSTRFDPEHPSSQPVTLASLAELYVPEDSTTAFTVVTGDVLPKYDESQLAALTQLYTRPTHIHPVMFVPGNFDLLPKKEPTRTANSFFTNEEYFLMITPQSDGSIGESQQISLLNQLLLLEKMPEIKTVFVLSHQANWIGYDAHLQSLSEHTVSRSPLPNDTFMLTQILPRLEAMQDKQVFLIAGDLNPTTTQTQFSYTSPNSNLHFLSGRAGQNPNDVLLYFTKENGSWNFTFKNASKGL